MFFITKKIRERLAKLDRYEAAMAEYKQVLSENPQAIRLLNNLDAEVRGEPISKGFAISFPMRNTTVYELLAQLEYIERVSIAAGEPINDGDEDTLRHRANMLAVRAAHAGLVLTITQKPSIPLSMGNHFTLVEVRPTLEVIRNKAAG